MVYKHDGQNNFVFINSRCEYTLCLDVEDAEPQPQVDIVTFVSQYEKTYAKHVGDAYMMEFELQKDFCVRTAFAINIITHLNTDLTGTNNYKIYV